MMTRDAFMIEIELQQLRDAFIGFARIAMARDPGIRWRLRKVIQTIEDRCPDNLIRPETPPSQERVFHAFQSVNALRSALFDDLADDPPPRRGKPSTML